MASKLSENEAFFCDDCILAINTKWVFVYRSGNTELLRIITRFDSPDTLKNRFNKGPQLGIDAEFTILEPSQPPINISGRWYFSEGFGEWDRIGRTFSNDDGAWGAASVVDGCTNRYLTTLQDFWGQGNFNGADSSKCGSLYKNGSSISVSDLIMEFYVESTTKNEFHNYQFKTPPPTLSPENIVLCDDYIGLNQSNGTYTVLGEDVYCDMEIDGGGWTLVGTTADSTLNDQGSDYYPDLANSVPLQANMGVWKLPRKYLEKYTDIRFTCSLGNSTVDLSFYNNTWYNTITTGYYDEQSDFNSKGDPKFELPARRNNLNGDFLSKGTPWSEGPEGEDAEYDTADFTIDFNDRGMDSNQVDGTDWGEDDGKGKCGTVQKNSVQVGGVWQIWVRRASEPTS